MSISFCLALCFTALLETLDVLHDADNSSDHEPIVLQLDLQVELVKFADRMHTPRSSWEKARDRDLAHCRLSLSHYLADIPIPHEALLCKNVTCCSVEHAQAIDAYANNISAACTAAAEHAIPQTCSRQNSRCIPGWSEQVQPLRDKSLFGTGSGWIVDDPEQELCLDV